jgi:asparagine synthase (glutamine-hydrolysing)
MSTIYGKLNLEGDAISQKNLSSIQDKLNHWNAEATGVWTNNTIGLGHLMLYNTPESLNEKLPYYKTESGLAITADARIDNRDELHLLLGLTSTEEKQLPDSTLILLLYEKYTKDCVKHLIGDFAFAIWDDKTRQLFCARDHMGIKPFFYYLHDSCFAFASEIKGLLALPEVDKSINTQFLYNQMFRSSEQKVDTTLYKHIHRLAPAHTLTLTPENKIPVLQQYWHLDADTEIKFDTQQEYYDALLQHFEKAVKCRLRTAYPIAAELSGGMDSSGITGVASRFLKEEGRSLVTISNTIPRHVTDEEQLQKSERTWIDAVVDFNHIEKAVYTVSAPADHVFSDIDFMLDVNSGPDSWEQHWQTPIRKAAKKEGVRTLLSGFPGDEMVTYRGKYYFLDYLDKKQYLKYLFAKRKFPGFHKLAPFIPHRIRYKLHLFKNKLGLYNKHIKTALKIFNIPSQAIKQKGDVNWLDPLVKGQFKSYRHYQKQRFLRYHLPARMESETRNGMYFGFEPRFPMADIRLVQYYLSMPNYIKYEGQLYRTAYRKAVGKYLPKEILERDDKRGGMTPYREPITDEAVIKAKQERSKALVDEMFKTLEGNPFIKPAALKEKRMNLTIFRWLEKQAKGEI